MDALHADVYPKKLFIKHLTEGAVRTAFNLSVSHQIKVQQQADANTSMWMFAVRAAVSIPYWRPTSDTHPLIIAEMAYGLFCCHQG